MQHHSPPSHPVSLLEGFKQVGQRVWEIWSQSALALMSVNPLLSVLLLKSYFPEVHSDL